MKYSEFKDKLCNIDISKECFKFLAERIYSDDYRDIQCPLPLSFFHPMRRNVCVFCCIIIIYRL